jgi:hypothetical protein
MTHSALLLLPPATVPQTDKRNGAAQDISSLASIGLGNGHGNRSVETGVSPYQHGLGFAHHAEDGRGAIRGPGPTLAETPISPRHHSHRFDLPSLPTLHRQPSNLTIAPSSVAKSSRINDRQVPGPDGNTVESPPTRDAVSFSTSVATPLPLATPTTHSPSTSDVPSFIALASPDDRNSRPDSSTVSTCRYPVLLPLLSILADIVPVSIACDLLEAYFDSPGRSLVEFGSPYVITHVLRRCAVLHESHPRPTSPALLLSMLHATAHTVDIACFHIPGFRASVCDKLYSAVVQQLDDPDCWHRLLNGTWVMLGGHEDSSAQGSTSAKERGKGGPAEPNLSTDVLLTLVLMTIVVSGGTFKADCLRWWNKALRLARVLKLSELDSKDEIEAADCSFSDIVAAEEKRRIFWLIFCLDRHLALSYNAQLAIQDAGLSVYLPMPESLWENLDPRTLPVPYHRSYGPKTAISGTDFFEFFLPLMTILGDIVLLHHRRLHPRFGALSDAADTAAVEVLLRESERSLRQLEEAAVDQARNIGMPSSMSSTRLLLVVAYSTHILHVLAVLLYGKWDPLEILRDPYTTSDSAGPVGQGSEDWTIPDRFMKCTSHAISASQTVAAIIELDPELVFMPYLFGIYLLHGSFILLLFADRMQQLGGPNSEVEQACETIVRAHEVCIATLSTEFQRSFRRMLRTTLYRVRRAGSTGLEETQARTNALEMYRWTRGGRGLAL